MSTSAKQIAAIHHDAHLVDSKTVPSELSRKSLMCYEMRLDRQLTRAFRLLRRQQNSDKPDSPPHPAAKNFFPQNQPISDGPNP